MQRHDLSPLPVTVFSGFLGAGKTTILNNILSSDHGYRIAVIVNDMSEINIDAQLIRHSGALSRADMQLVEMTNGCICCTLRDDLLKEVSKLAERGCFDYLLIESSGISEPLPVAQTFTFSDENGVSLSARARLDTMVSVVDGRNFLQDYFSQDDLHHRTTDVSSDEPRGIADLLVDQIEYANVLVITKCDLIDDSTLTEIEHVLRGLNPGAVIVRSTMGAVPIGAMLSTNLFSMEALMSSPGWLRELQNEHVPETLEYGISSFVFRARRPFHPERLLQHLESGEWDSILRSKGYLWLATRNDHGCLWSQAGSSCKLEPAGKWLAAVDESEWPAESEKDRAKLRESFVGDYGDRRQEVVIIGQSIEHDALRASLESCLLNETELEKGPMYWATFVDPFPEWQFDIER